MKKRKNKSKGHQKKKRVGTGAFRNDGVKRNFLKITSNLDMEPIFTAVSLLLTLQI